LPCSASSFSSSKFLFACSAKSFLDPPLSNSSDGTEVAPDLPVGDVPLQPTAPMPGADHQCCTSSLRAASFDVSSRQILISASATVHQK
jgi:hypothetical protein